MTIEKMYHLFPTKDTCLRIIETARWNGNRRCPRCGAKKATPAPKENRYHCNTCLTSFSAIVGTMLHNTKTDLQKWFLILTLALEPYQKLSIRDLSVRARVNKNTAWRITREIQKAMFQEPDFPNALYVKLKERICE